MLNLNKRKYYLAALAIFFLINLGAIFFSWQGRNLPPEPDDTGAFLIFLEANIKYGGVFSRQVKVLTRPFVWNSYGGMDRVTYFSWALFWGKLARIFSIKPETILQLSFYFGIILFLTSVLYFFKEKDWRFKSILIFTLAFFTGHGTYHGLFWPAPSLYSISLFLFILKILLEGRKYWFWKTIFLLPAFLLAHPLSLISLFALPIFIVFSWFCHSGVRMNIRMIESTIKKRLLALLFLSFIFYLGWFRFLSFKNINLLRNTNVIYSVVSQLLDKKLTFSKQAAKVITDEYFLYLLTRPFFLTLFILGIIRIFKEDRKIFVLYFSFISLMLAGLFFSGGQRILLFIWILSFFIFAFGLIYLIELLTKIIKNRLAQAKRKKLFLLLLINFILETIFLVFIFKADCAKNIILKKFFIYSKLTLLLVTVYALLVKKKIIVFWLITGMIVFFSHLLLEKSAMLVFQRNRTNFSFDKEIFFSKINSDKKGLIIYNDNLSFALFSGSGLLERETVKKDYLREGDLEKAAYFITSKRTFKPCQRGACWLEDKGVKKEMKRITDDDNFSFYEF